MKETWNYYVYLRRWGVLLLVGLVVGGLVGFGLYFQQDRPDTFQAQATVSVAGPKNLMFTVVSGHGFTNPNDAVQTIFTTADRLAERIKTPWGVEVRDIKIFGRSRYQLWKAIVLGSIIGGLMIIGGAYVWEDARAFQRKASGTTKR